MKIMCGGREAPATPYFHMYFTFISYEFHILGGLHIICTFPCTLFSHFWQPAYYLHSSLHMIFILFSYFREILVLGPVQGS